MDIINKFKSLILSGALSFSKAEKEILQEILTKSNPEIRNEERVQQQEIKILSEKRFYQILDNADLYISKRDQDRLNLMLESRGLGDVELILENGRRSAEFKTSNGLSEHSHLVHVTNFGGGNKQLKFFIDTKRNPESYNAFSNLKYFETENDRNRYQYSISGFIGSERINNYTIALKYFGTPTMNGESIVNMNESDDQVRIMKKDDLIDPTKINYTDHLRSRFRGE